MKEDFTPEQSLQLIQTMIEKTRRSYSDKTHYFLIWGWTVMFALLGQFVLKRVFEYPRHYYVWWLTVFAVIVTLFLVMKDRNKEGVRSYVSESMSNLWTGMSIGFFVISMIFVKIGWSHCYPFFITLYGLGTFISGRILQFFPFVVGAMVAWVFAIASAWFNMEYQMLFAAAALLVSYIIPGHMLSAKYRNERSQYQAA